ncbi:MAG: UDP-3-O-(3-hydroxymyristoyl)glucosamine N-acyltransferase [Gammaproteobacteria bacterium]
MTAHEGFTLLELSKLINAKLIGDGEAIVDNLSTIQNSNKTSLTFLSNKKYSKYIKTSEAKAFIVHQDFVNEDDKKNFLVSEDPYLSYAMASKLFSPFYNDLNNSGIHSTAIVSSDAKIGNNVSIGANVYIGPNCVIGDNSCIQPNVSLVCNVKLGSNCNIFPGTVLGSDGFGYAPTKNGYVKIEQLGSLVIGDNVEIGAGCTIDRGALDDTIIHDGVKLDNQIHIAHNVDLGKNSAIAACCAIAGSTVIGENFRMGGLSGVLGHLSITDNVSVGAHTLITKNISEGGEYIGIMPAQNPKDWAKSSIFIKKRK